VQLFVKCGLLRYGIQAISQRCPEFETHRVPIDWDALSSGARISKPRIGKTLMIAG